MIKRFALTNDIDHGLLKRYKMIYECLNQNGIKVSTSLFCKLEDDGSSLAKHCYKNETESLENVNFCSFVKDMISCGHEFSYHGYSQVSNTRTKFLDGIKIFEDKLQFRPRTYVEHGGMYKHHPDGMVKKESLLCLGSVENSKYFVKDIISNYFDMVWTHEYLIENARDRDPSKIFEKKDKIIYLNRVRNYHLPEVISKFNTVIGYTHFGYDGYKKTINRLLPFFMNKNTKLECWDNAKSISNLIKILKDLVQENQMIFSSLNEIYDNYVDSLKFIKN